MSLPDCIHCQQPPERREHEGRVMLICPVCNNRGEASSLEAWALESWRQVNRADLSPCGCGNSPRFRQRESQWWACCTGCAQMAGGFMSLQGAVAGWMRRVR